MRCRPLLALALCCLLMPVAVGAQQANIAFGGLKQDTSLPVQVEADSLTVEQASGTAVFSGNVRVAQGDLKLAAARVQVEYAADGKAIERLHASGGVTMANASDAAEAKEAVYTIDSGNLVMTGDVLLTQGQSAIAGQKLVIDLKAGTGVMEGRVSTTFVPGSK